MIGFAAAALALLIGTVAVTTGWNVEVSFAALLGRGSTSGCELRLGTGRDEARSGGEDEEPMPEGA